MSVIAKIAAGIALLHTVVGSPSSLAAKKPAGKGGAHRQASPDVPAAHRQEVRRFGPREALARFYKGDPDLAMMKRRHQALRSAQKFVGKWPNPVVEYSREQLFPLESRDLVGVRLPLPVSGRLGRKRAAFRARSKLARVGLESKRFKRGLAFLKAYWRLRALQLEIGLEQKSLRWFEALKRIIAARTGAGLMPGAHLLRVNLELRQRTGHIKRMKDRALALGERLASAMGLPGQRLVPSGPLACLFRPPALKVLKQWTERSAAVKQYRAAHNHARTRAELARSVRWPDLDLWLGYIHQRTPAPERGHSHGFAVGLSWPLPFSRENRAEEQIHREAARSAAWRLRLHRQNASAALGQTWKQLVRAQQRLKTYRREVVPRGPALLKAAWTAFLGRGPLADYLEAHAATEDIGRTELTLQEESRRLALELGRLSGTHYYLKEQR